MSNGKANDTKQRAPQVWGKRSHQFLGELRGQEVVVALVNGSRYGGRLIGVDTYDIIIRQSSGLEILFPKGNILYVHPSGAVAVRRMVTTNGLGG